MWIWFFLVVRSIVFIGVLRITFCIYLFFMFFMFVYAFMFKWLSFHIISPVRSSFFLLIIKHHKFLIELRNIIHTGASKLDSIHIHWFGLFSNGFHSFGCNSILSGIYIQLELILKKSLTHKHTLHEHIAHAVCQMRMP